MGKCCFVIVLDSELPGAAIADGNGRPILYFTFDDGPSNFTGQVMEAIRPYDGKITFFVIGQNVTALPATAAALQQGYVFDVLCR